MDSYILLNYVSPKLCDNSWFEIITTRVCTDYYPNLAYENQFEKRTVT